MTDMEICVKLAAFMGWQEIEPPPPLGADGLPEKYWYPRASSVFFAVNNQNVPWAWQPLNRPDHAALVMEEAARRGWSIDISVEPQAKFRNLHTKAQIQTPEDRKSGKGWFAVEDLVTPESWCRAVCRAVLYTLEGIEREAAITPQERLEMSV